MKKLGKLKLNQLNKAEIQKRELNALRGGCGSMCGCLYEGEQCSSGDDYYGGSSQDENAIANADQSYYSSGG
ncbi:MAG: TIGR04149 family rSAM-modified RiPP [bacterium]|jgi:natural product precursor